LSARRLLACVIFLVSIPAGRCTAADAVCKIVGYDDGAFIIVDRHQPRRIEGDTTIGVDSQLKTDATGRIRALLAPVGESVAFEMSPDTLVQILERKGRVEVVKLNNGSVLMQGPGEAETPTVPGIIGKGTAFIVHFDKNEQRTQVIGVSGHVEVTLAADSEPIAVAFKDQLSITADHKFDLTTLGEDELEGWLRRFEFIGEGRAESQLVASRLAEEKGLKPTEQAPISFDEWPKVNDPPFVEPSGVVKATTLGVEF